MSISPNQLKRAERCVCKQCGNPIEPAVVIYNKYGGSGVELYCQRCKKIEYGTEPEIYRLSKKFVDHFEFNYFTEMEENERSYMLNIAKITEILSWALKEVKVLDQEGVHNLPCDFNIKEEEEEE